MTITPEMVERGAKALLALHGGQEAVENYPKMPPHIRERWASRARAVLEAGLERLRAVHGITDEIVEAAARAIYDRRLSLAWGVKPVPWDSIPRDVREEWREVARAGLEAASGAMTVQVTPEQITSDMIERGAQALHAAEMPGEPSWAIESYWQKLNEAGKGEYRQRARLCLEAARTVALAHLCATCAQSMCRRRRDIEDACEDPLFPARAVVVECKAHVADKGVQEVLEGV